MCYHTPMLKRTALLALPLFMVACGGSNTASGSSDSGTGTEHDAGKGGAKDAGSTSTEAGTPSKEAGSASDAGAEAAFTAGMPITAAPAAWTWIPFPNAVCGNGTATGIGVNLSSTPDARVLLYLEGGGACWSDLTCNTLMTATYVTTGYGEAEFTAESTDVTYLAEPGGFFDRTSAANPFKDYSYVYVPYCTGDVHAGNNTVMLGAANTHFAGYTNFGAYLDRLVPTFPSADRVILAGSSAGGFGAAFNWERTQNAFGGIRVDLIDDSGTAMPASIQSEGMALSTYSVPWNLATTLPAGCTACATDFSALYKYYDTLYATHRGALLSYTEDSVLPTFFGVTTAEFTTGLDDDLAAYFTASDPLKSFVVGAPGHVLFFSPTLATASGATVQEFVTQMVTDDASWADEGP